MLFAFAIASAGVRKVSTDSTGPKISSRAIRDEVETLSKIVGANQKPFSGMTHGAVQRSAPSSSPTSLSILMRASCSRRVDRADVGVLVERIAETQGRQSVLESLDHLVVDVLLHEQAAAGAADVALVEEDAVDDALDRLVDGCVVEDDVGRLAAELEGDLLAGSGDRLGDLATDRRWTP